jgi:hypothetical protein
MMEVLKIGRRKDNEWHGPTLTIKKNGDIVEQNEFEDQPFGDKIVTPLYD